MDLNNYRGLMEAFEKVHAPQGIEELYKGKHGQSEKEYQDSRSDAGKMISGDSKRSGAAYSSRAVKNTGPNPAGGKERPKAQGRMGSKDREYLAYRKANLKKEELEATGLFTAEEIERILDIMCEDQFDEALSGERYKKVMKKPGGTAYSRMVSADPSKRATRGGRGGESDFGAGDRGSGNKSRRRRGLPVGDED